MLPQKTNSIIKRMLGHIVMITNTIKLIVMLEMLDTNWSSKTLVVLLLDTIIKLRLATFTSMNGKEKRKKEEEMKL